MHHDMLQGTHYTAGFRWGALLRERGNILLREIPFAVTKERVDYARACLLVYQTYYPEVLEEIQGIADGQQCDAGILHAVLLSMYAMPPGRCCSCLAVAGEQGVFLGRNSDFLTALEHLNLRSRKFASAPGPHVVVPIISGGNIDTVTIGAVIQKGMIARGRIMNFEVELPDTPGQLVKVATILAQERANVIALDHDQFKASGVYTNAVALGVTVETNGPDHIDRILAALREAGYQPRRIY